MKKQIQSLWFVGAAALLLSAGSLSAQSTAPTQTPDSQSTQTPAPEAQQPQTQEGQQSQTPEAQQNQTPSNQTPDTQSQTAPSQAQPSQSPDATGQGSAGAASSAQAAGSQSFSGTVVKSGDKYVLKDEASGNTYDIDHQDQVQKFEGKRVRVHGTLDASGKMIHLQ